MGNCVNGPCNGRNRRNVSKRGEINEQMNPTKKREEINKPPQQLMNEGRVQINNVNGSQVRIENTGNEVVEQIIHERVQPVEQRRQIRIQIVRNGGEDNQEVSEQVRRRRDQESLLEFINLIQIYEALHSRGQVGSFEDFLVAVRLLLNQEPQGLSKQQIQKIKVVVARQDGSCAICQDNIETGQQMIRLFCRHEFHQSCLKPWLQRAQNCPICRQIIRVNGD